MPTDTLDSAVQFLRDLKATDELAGFNITCDSSTFSADARADLEAVQIFLQQIHMLFLLSLAGGYIRLCDDRDFAGSAGE